MKVRKCKLGEGLRQSGACYECPQGTYLLQAPVEPQDCVPCDPDKTICSGGKNVGPNANYWRDSALSYNFYKCPVDGRCLGMDTSLPYDYPGNQLGLCDIENGYYGVMCTACLPGYKRAPPFDCEICGSGELLKTMLIMVGMLFGVVFLVRSTLKGALKASNSSVFYKIMMNHLQMLIITSDF